MKHLFIINPAAGGHNAANEIRQNLQHIDDSVDCLCYETTGVEDAMRYTKSWIERHPDEPVRFYACGGDGTLNEVVRGMMDANTGHENAEVTNYPNGSGNDYIKYYGGMKAKAAFSSLSDLTAWKSELVDVLEIEQYDADGNIITGGAKHYSINVLNFGFDADVCDAMGSIRRIPLLNKNAYATCVLKATFTSMRNQCSITVDGSEFFDGTMLLCTAANGAYVGGTYRCSPRSVNSDGLLEICLVYCTSVRKFAKLEKIYRRGEHLDMPNAEKILRYCRGKEIEVKSRKPFNLCIDGEILVGSHFKMTNRQQKIRFAFPPTIS